ncbi:MAG: dUTP diphosphatase [Clostridiales bacterium]|nr:MAG: dUTP diphosphatase [Clostridiales bacterium]
MSVLKIVNKSNNDMPCYATLGSSGIDLRAYLEEDICLKPLERKLISTGLFVEIPVGFEGQVRARSGLSIKHGLTLINAVGTIDSDYRGELKVPMVNLSNDEYTIKSGDRIAQLVIAKYERVDIEEVSSLTDTDRGEGGFGSTGKR